MLHHGIQSKYYFALTCHSCRKISAKTKNATASFKLLVSILQIKVFAGSSWNAVCVMWFGTFHLIRKEGQDRQIQIIFLDIMFLFITAVYPPILTFKIHFSAPRALVLLCRIKTPQVSAGLQLVWCDVTHLMLVKNWRPEWHIAISLMRRIQTVSAVNMFWLMNFCVGYNQCNFRLQRGNAIGVHKRGKKKLLLPVWTPILIFFK